MYLHSMAIKMAAASSKALPKWQRFHRFALPKVPNSRSRNVRWWGFEILGYRTSNRAFLRAHIFLRLFFAIFGRNNRIVTSSHLPKLAFSRTDHVGVGPQKWKQYKKATARRMKTQKQTWRAAVIANKNSYSERAVPLKQANVTEIRRLDCLQIPKRTLICSCICPWTLFGPRREQFSESVTQAKLWALRSK